MRVFGAALAGGFQPGFDPRPRLARRRQAGLGLAQHLVRLAQRIRRLGKLIGRGFARRFGLSDLVQDLVARRSAIFAGQLAKRRQARF